MVNNRPTIKIREDISGPKVRLLSERGGKDLARLEGAAKADGPKDKENVRGNMNKRRVINDPGLTQKQATPPRG